MPIYTYQCQSCGSVLEKRQSFADAPLTTCEACSGELRKLLHPVGIVFKGSGFYNTDYRGNGAAKTTETKDEKSEGGETNPAASANGASESASPPKSESGDAKPAPKAEPSTASPKAD